MNTLMVIYFQWNSSEKNQWKISQNMIIFSGFLLENVVCTMVAI